MTAFNSSLFRQQFPLISCDINLAKPALIYFDNAATTQKPKSVIAGIENYYRSLNANVHRASHQLSTKATVAFEQARKLTQNFIGAQSEKEIVWTSGTTESINIITQSLARSTLSPGDEIVLSVSEHHANIVPWQIVAEQTGAVIKVVTINSKGIIDLDELDRIIGIKTKFVACAHVSNVIGKINPITEIIKKAKSVGAITIIDGAQSVAHFSVDVQSLDCDFYVFSAHKMYGPTGIGVLYGKQQLLESMPPYQGGGEMIKTVSLSQGSTYNTLPFKFEAGTPNISGVIGLAEAIKFVTPLIMQNNTGYRDFETSLVNYCYQSLAAINGVNFVVDSMPDIGVIAFTITDHHNQDISSALDNAGIAIRAGHHCAMPLMSHLAIDGCLRVSLAAYNTRSEVDYLIEQLKRILAEESTDLANENDLAKKGGSSRSKVIKEESKDIKTIQPTHDIDVLISLFSKVKGWDGRHREIMLLGKKLQRLDKSFRNEQTLINGCESLAWLHATKNDDGIYIFSADSDAKIIRGLLFIVLAAFNHKTTQQISAVNIDDFFNKLGLMQHLSPSRGNGLLSIVEKIQSLASST